MGSASFSFKGRSSRFRIITEIPNTVSTEKPKERINGRGQKFNFQKSLNCESDFICSGPKIEFLSLLGARLRDGQ